MFAAYASSPELAQLVNAITFKATVAPQTNRTDLVGIFIPDLIKVDLSTGPARLASGGALFPDHPDDAGFSDQGIFGGDTLTSTVQAATVPGTPRAPAQAAGPTAAVSATTSSRLPSPP